DGRAGKSLDPVRAADDDQQLARVLRTDAHDIGKERAAVRRRARMAVTGHDGIARPRSCEQALARLAPGRSKEIGRCPHVVLNIVRAGRPQLSLSATRWLKSAMVAPGFPVALTLTLLDLLEEWGIDTAAVLSRAGVARSSLTRPGGSI